MERLLQLVGHRPVLPVVTVRRRRHIKQFTLVGKRQNRSGIGAICLLFRSDPSYSQPGAVNEVLWGLLLAHYVRARHGNFLSRTEPNLSPSICNQSPHNR